MNAELFPVGNGIGAQPVSDDISRRIMIL